VSGLDTVTALIEMASGKLKNWL